MRINLREVTKLGQQVEKELIDLDIKPEVSAFIGAHIQSTIEEFLIMGTENIDLSHLLAISLKDVLKQQGE